MQRLPAPKVGDEIYVPTPLAQPDDREIIGGKGIVTQVIQNGPETIWVEVNEVPDYQYNWHYLGIVSVQEKLQQEFNNNRAAVYVKET